MLYTLEIATFTLPAAFQAQAAGAHRLELCENPQDGGTTPSMGMLSVIRKLIHIPVFPIIRPRGGHFVYTADEQAVMLEDIALCRQLGFPGLVTGALLPNGDIDVSFMEKVIQLAGPMEVTFHRAFDRCRDPLQSLEVLIELGCCRILSSGQRPSVADGIELVRTLVQQAAGRIIMLPGSGLNSRNVAHIAQVSGAREFHTAARCQVRDESVFSPSGMQESMSYVGVDVEEVAKILAELKRIS